MYLSEIALLLYKPANPINDFAFTLTGGDHLREGENHAEAKGNKANANVAMSRSADDHSTDCDGLLVSVLYGSSTSQSTVQSKHYTGLRENEFGFSGALG